MPDIKFRAFVKKTNKIINVDKINFEEKYITRYLDNLPFPTSAKYPFEDIVLMQYVGIKDKNNKEVYDGDIVKLDDDVKQTFNLQDGVIKYVGGSFLVSGNNGNLLSTLLCLVDVYYSLRGEVIGNIYENPELLNNGMKVKLKEFDLPSGKEYGVYCPKCNAGLSWTYKQNHCPRCGEKLSWDGVEDGE